MHNDVGYQRSAEGLKKAIQTLQLIRAEEIPRLQAASNTRIYNYEWEEALEAAFMVDLGEMIAASALSREESRGHHWRTDFPNMRSEWEKHTIVRINCKHEYVVMDAPVVRLKDRTRERRVADPVLLKAGVLSGYEK